MAYYFSGVKNGVKEGGYISYADYNTLTSKLSTEAWDGKVNTSYVYDTSKDTPTGSSLYVPTHKEL
jgi:hypothetical protein